MRGLEGPARARGTFPTDKGCALAISTVLATEAKVGMRVLIMIACLIDERGVLKGASIQAKRGILK